MKLFGCDSYVHVPREKQNKLDNKDEKCIFIGYKDGMKGYKVWNLVTKKTIYSGDFVFREVREDPIHELTPMEREPEKIDFELKDEEYESTISFTFLGSSSVIDKEKWEWK